MNTLLDLWIIGFVYTLGLYYHKTERGNYSENFKKVVWIAAAWPYFCYIESA